jgi:hypothetical protein
LTLFSNTTSFFFVPATVIAYRRQNEHMSLHIGLVWLLSFGARIKEFIYDSNNNVFGCHGIGYKIHLEFHGFSSHA